MAFNTGSATHPANPILTGHGDSSSSDGGYLADLVSNLKSDRVKEGLCPTCGTRLYKVKKPNPFARKRHPEKNPIRYKPLTIEGEVLRGQCLKCSRGHATATAVTAATVTAAVGTSRSSHGSNHSSSTNSSSSSSSNHDHYNDNDNDNDNAAAIAIASLDDHVLNGTRNNHAHNAATQPEGPSRTVPPPPPVVVASPIPRNGTNNNNITAASTSNGGRQQQQQQQQSHQICATYKGDYNRFGERHGRGTLRWSNGDVYIGDFINGMRDGEGTLHFADGTEYVGGWRNNLMHGSGTRRFPNGDVYTGQYTSGKRSGQGRCYFANGDMYVGSWHNDKLNGFGRYYYNNGQSFEGNFRDGKRDGRGKYQFTDGRIDIYKYCADVRVGEGVRWSADRRKAWRLLDGKVKWKVSLDDAAKIARQCGEGAL